MEIKSVFEDGEDIPKKYTCQGKNISPPLTLSDIPDEALSLALLMYDPDIPDEIKSQNDIEQWDHWVLFNINPVITEIEEGKIPTGTMIGINTGRELGYQGPCPPDEKPHRYFFKLYALDIILDLPKGVTREELEEEIQGHIIEEATLIGRYQKS